jgi:hypothetical protein
MRELKSMTVMFLAFWMHAANCGQKCRNKERRRGKRERERRKKNRELH